MINLPPVQTVGVFGPVASGKTFLLRKWLEREGRVVAFDSTGELLDQHGFIQVWSSPQQLLARIEESPYAFRISYVPGRNIQEDFDYCVRILFHFDAPKLLAVDEAHLVCPNNAIPGDVEMLLRFARHAKLGLVLMSQRIADVHKLATSACRMVVLFWTMESRDLLAISDRWGTDVAETVRNLRPLIYDDTTQTVKQIPQCVVVAKGSAPKIFDFEKDSFVTKYGTGFTDPTVQADELEETPTNDDDDNSESSSGV